MKFQNRLLSGILIFSLCCLPGCDTASTESNPSVPTDTRDLSTAELVSDMGLGWNLGNTLDASGVSNAYYVSDCETAWGNPFTTKDMIQFIADSGFHTVRVPIAWSNMMSSTYEIDADLMLRVEEVVGYVLDCGMYAIIDIHWDGGWIQHASTDYNNTMDKYQSVWKQITTRFSGYSDYLLFESLNEEGSFPVIWDGTATDETKQQAYDLLHDFNQTFVDIVRASGGRNTKRHLLIAGYADQVKYTCDEAYSLPDDPAERCAVSIHYDIPVPFAAENGSDAASTWGTDAERKELETNMNLLQSTFVAQGIPVVISEYGALGLSKDETIVRDYTFSVAKAAKSRNMCPILWDNGSFFNRKTLVFSDPALLTELQTLM